MSVCSGVRVVLVSEPTVFTSSYSDAHSSLPRSGGGSTRNCELFFIVNGVTLASQGVSPGASEGGVPGNSDGVGLHWPIAVLPRKGTWFGGKRPSFDRSARIAAAAWAPTATPGSKGLRLFAARKFA